MGVFAGKKGLIGAVSKVAGPVGIVASALYYGGKLLNKAGETLSEKITGERVTKTRYPSGLEYVLPFLVPPFARIKEKTNPLLITIFLR